MAEQSTFIKLDRNMLNWRWWKNRNTLQVFIWLLFKANVADHDFENETIHRGQVATSLQTIANSCGLTIMQVRTTILHLISTGEITSKSCNRFRIITIVNYDSYQSKVTSKITGKQQADNKQITSKQQQYKNDKNDKNEKNNNTPSGYPYPCGLWEKPKWMTAEEWEKARYLSANDIPGLYRGEYDSIIEYLHDKKKGCLK
ncbi:MAG: hypothetical protein J6Y60_03315 [Treponema sp.]|nr:hypothetical protein [Treponema sp.]